jgi:hypothetical protein
MPPEFALNLDFNSKSAGREAYASLFAEIIDSVPTVPDERRTYVGASQIGDECARRIYYEVTGAPRPDHSARTRRIFARGHLYEERMARLLARAGFVIDTEKPGGDQFGFEVLAGRFQGHVDGVVRSAPSDVMTALPAIWENKALGSKGFYKLRKDGVEKAYPNYLAQVTAYQGFMDITAPALFTAICPDTEEVYAELIPYDERRFQRIADRVVDIVDAVDIGHTPDRAASEPEAFVCAFCGFRSHCWGQ